MWQRWEVGPAKRWLGHQAEPLWWINVLTVNGLAISSGLVIKASGIPSCCCKHDLLPFRLPLWNDEAKSPSRDVRTPTFDFSASRTIGKNEINVYSLKITLSVVFCYRNTRQPTHIIFNMNVIFYFIETIFRMSPLDKKLK